MNQEEFSGPIVVGVEEFEMEELEALTLQEVKEVLMATFLDADTMYDDESSSNEGWRIRLNREDEGLSSDAEEKIDLLLSRLTNDSLDLSTLSTQAAEATGHANEQGQYTNLSYFFLREKAADDHLDQIRQRIYALQVPEEKE